MSYDYEEDVSAQLSASINKIVIPFLTPIYFLLNAIDWVLVPSLALEFLAVRATIIPAVFFGHRLIKKDPRQGPFFLIWICAFMGSLQLTYMGLRAGDSAGSFYHQSINLVAGVLLLLTPLPPKQNIVTLLCVYLPPVIGALVFNPSGIFKGLTFSIFLLYAGMIVLFGVAGSGLDRLRKKAFQQKVSLFFMATTDTLSGLKLRRYFFNRFIQELSLKFRTAKEINVSVAAFDIDHFKSINDQYGHDVGDQCIRHVADILRKSVRIYDVVCRFGGEEFMLLFPETRRKDAKIACESILRKVESTPWKNGKLTIPLTLSSGISGIEAVIPENEGKDLKGKDNRFLLIKHMMRVVKSADKVLYEAKKNGRNRICTAEAVGLDLDMTAGEMLEYRDYMNYFEEPFYLTEPQKAETKELKLVHEFNRYSEDYFFRRCVESIYRSCRNPEWTECLVLIRLRGKDSERAGLELQKTIRLADAICSIAPGVFGVIFFGMKETDLPAFLSRFEERVFVLYGEKISAQIASAPLMVPDLDRSRIKELSSYRPLTVRAAELMTRLKNYRFREDEKIVCLQPDLKVKKAQQLAG